MIEQNQAAIAIANAEAREGSDPAVKRLAAAIAASRKRELARIHGWLRLWYGDVQPGGGLGPPGGGGGQSPGPGSPSPSPGGAPHVPL
jgi:Domain of unknown function (DUF305)